MQDRERQRILALLPKPPSTPDIAIALNGIDPDPLAELVIDAAQPWWRRRACAQALVGRVPAAHARALAERVCDAKDTSEVRRAVLELLSANRGEGAGEHGAGLLAWMRRQEGVEQAYGMEEAILAARGHFGDASAAPALASLANDPWPHRRAIAEGALDVLIATRGLGGVLAALGAADLAALAFTAERPADRLLGVRLRHRAGAGIARALADADVVVAHAAHALMADGSGASDDELVALFEEGRGAVSAGLTPELPSGAAGACLWSLCVLMRRGRDVRSRWIEVGCPRVEIADVPDDVRLAIVREYAPGSRRTDPRWLLEREHAALPEEPDEEAELERAVSALAAAGLSPAAPRSAGAIYRQGSGSYHTIAFAGGDVTVSTLGPFVAFEVDVPRARDALASAGFRIIEPALAATSFTGLAVYFFGHRDPLPIQDLLFYWQD